MDLFTISKFDCTSFYVLCFFLDIKNKVNIICMEIFHFYLSHMVKKPWYEITTNIAPDWKMYFYKDLSSIHPMKYFFHFISDHLWFWYLWGIVPKTIHNHRVYFWGRRRRNRFWWFPISISAHPCFKPFPNSCSCCSTQKWK